MAATLMKFAKAKTDDDSFRALESWVKLKAVLVLPLGSKKRRSSSRKFHQEQMLNWVAGNEEDCWVKATKVEQDRKNSSKRRDLKPKSSFGQNERVDALTTAQITKYKRAKNLVNVREISKAMATILSNGVANVDDEVLKQLRNKHPPRPSPAH